MAVKFARILCYSSDGARALLIDLYLPRETRVDLCEAARAARRRVMNALSFLHPSRTRAQVTIGQNCSQILLCLKANNCSLLDTMHALL
jgi:hypothetical protein